jgi:hypothetical protein
MPANNKDRGVNQMKMNRRDFVKAASAATSGFIVFLPPVRPGDPQADIARARAAFHGAAALSGRVLEGSPPLTPWQPCFESTVGRPYSFEPALS